MIDAWDEYDYRKDSDNDRPGNSNCCKIDEEAKWTIPSAPHSDVFGASQQYIAFLLENSGMQFGSYVVSIIELWVGAITRWSCFLLQYHSFDEALSILRQVTLSLAIAEEVGLYIILHRNACVQH